MSEFGQKIIERISALPPEDREAVEDEVLRYIDRLAAIRQALSESEEDIAAGRVAPLEDVAKRLRRRYAP